MVSPLFTRTQAISPLTRKGPMAPPLVPRQPLAAIELGMEGDVEEDQPRRRLVKRQSSPTRSNSLEVRDASPSPSPSKSRNSKPRNVFDVMQRAANLQHRDAAKTERRLQKSEFIEGEAEESDDDAMMGFGPRNKVDEDEEDDESQDQTLTELVDDAAMDAETLAEHAVIEKHRYERRPWCKSLIESSFLFIESINKSMTKPMRSFRRMSSPAIGKPRGVTAESASRIVILKTTMTMTLRLVGERCPRSVKSKAIVLSSLVGYIAKANKSFHSSSIS